MAVMGPDIDFARKQGRSVGEKVFGEIVKTNHLIDPLDPNEVLLVPNAKKRWTAIKKRFIAAVEDMFEEDACNGF